jgi:general stress protein 26
MESRGDQAARDKVVELLKGVRVAMMATTGEDGRMHARPMATSLAVSFDGHLWFFTDASSPKVAEVERTPDVLLTYADESDQHYVSVEGRASIVRDRAKVAELWSEPLRTWFPKGLDDPSIVLVKVEVERAEYWDSPSSTVVYLYGYVKALATGERPNPGDSASVRF